MEGRPIFRFLSDLALLEEVRFRLGHDETRRLVGSEDENWPNSWRHSNRVPPEKKRILLAWLMAHLTDDEIREAEIAQALIDRVAQHPGLLKLLGQRRQPPRQNGT